MSFHYCNNILNLTLHTIDFLGPLVQHLHLIWWMLLQSCMATLTKKWTRKVTKRKYKFFTVVGIKCRFQFI